MKRTPVMTRNMNFHRTVIKLVSSCISCLLVCIVIMIEFWWLSYHLLTGMVILFGFWCHSSCLLTCWGRCYYCALLVHLCFIFVRFFGMAVLWDSMVYTDWKQLHILHNQIWKNSHQFLNRFCLVGIRKIFQNIIRWNQSLKLNKV